MTFYTCNLAPRCALEKEGGASKIKPLLADGFRGKLLPERSKLSGCCDARSPKLVLLESLELFQVELELKPIEDGNVPAPMED